MAWGIAVLVMLAITGGVGSLCGPASAPPKPRPAIYVGGWTVGQKFLDALKITRPVRSLTIHCPANGLVTVELEHIMQADDVEPVREVLALNEARPAGERS